MEKKISAPEGGRVHPVTVLVETNRNWKEVVDAAAPVTKLRDPDGQVVDALNEHFFAKSGRARATEMVLVNFPPGSLDPWHDAMEWAEQYQFRVASPQPVFAIGEHLPQLAQRLGRTINLVPTHTCVKYGREMAFRLCYQNSSGETEDRLITLCRASLIGKTGNDWFVFLVG